MAYQHRWEIGRIKQKWAKFSELRRNSKGTNKETKQTKAKHSKKIKPKKDGKQEK